MKILIIGAGGREHAITWALRHTSAHELQLYCAQGNAGIAHDAQLVHIPAEDHSQLSSFARSEGIDLTFVGPEAPLAAGLVDAFERAGIPIVGPTAAAARKNQNPSPHQHDGLLLFPWPRDDQSLGQ